MYIEELKFINPQERNEEDGEKRAGISEATSMKMERPMALSFDLRGSRLWVGWTQECVRTEQIGRHLVEDASGEDGWGKKVGEKAKITQHGF